MTIEEYTKEQYPDASPQLLVWLTALVGGPWNTQLPEHVERPEYLVWPNTHKAQLAKNAMKTRVRISGGEVRDEG